jgi:hypothetical protein
LRRRIFAISGTVRYSLSGGPTSAACLLIIALLGRSALYFNREEFFERSGEHYRELDARQKTRRTVGFSYVPDPQKVCNVRIWHAHFINGVLQMTLFGPATRDLRRGKLGERRGGSLAPYANLRKSSPVK